MTHEGRWTRTAAATAEAISVGELDVRQVVRESLDRADAVGAWTDGLNLLVARDDAGTDDEVADIRRRAMDGVPLPMHGLPIVLKDNIATTRMPTTCGSRILAGYVSPFEATVVERLRDAGAVVIAKSNMDEFAMGSSTELGALGPARNPLAPDRVTGGSSGGSAGAVAAGIVAVALGSETGGSVRQPAAFCGVVGVKPTYGRVSRHGLIAYASSLDQVGVFGATVDDAALGLGVIAGSDSRDATAAEREVPDYRATDGTPLDGVVIGRPAEYFPEDLDPGIRARCDRALETLASLGAEIREVSLPHTALAVPVYYIVAPAEASSNLARFDGARYGVRAESDDLRDMYERTRQQGFGPEVIRRIVLGSFVLSAGYYDAYYRKAQEVRGLIARDLADVFRSGVHLLFTPTTPTTAFRHGAISDPYEMYLSDVFTCTANLAGVPAMSLPIGRIDGLPVGGQLMAGHFDEATMFGAAYALERALGDRALT